MGFMRSFKQLIYESSWVSIASRSSVLGRVILTFFSPISSSSFFSSSSSSSPSAAAIPFCFSVFFLLLISESLRFSWIKVYVYV